jgi:exonuclease SbcD
MKVLCAGDIHIGRRPSRLPKDVDGGGLSCALAWSAIVDRAVEEEVDVVALSGDLVDQSNRYYEAIGPLEAGIRKLVARGIRTVAVAGNHDHDVLPWLADAFPREEFALLGRGARWERLTLERDGRPALHVDGWSFADRSHREDPLQGYELVDPADVPVLGLLHCDLDQPRSAYAPVRLEALRRKRVGFWLLGHVHAPRHIHGNGAGHVLYPGSPQAMDPGEPGPHGAWLVEIDGGARFSARHLPLSAVRYESIQVDVSGATDEADIGRRATEAVRRRLIECVESGCGPLRFLSLRLRLTGRTAMHRRLREIAGEMADLEIEHGGVKAIVERASRETRPARDLEALARNSDAPGELARLLLALDSGSLSPEHERLVRQAERAAADARGAPTYGPLPAEEVELSADETRGVLADQAVCLLDELLAQKEAS